MRVHLEPVMMLAEDSTIKNYNIPDNDKSLHHNICTFDEWSQLRKFDLGMVEFFLPWSSVYFLICKSLFCFVQCSTCHIYTGSSNNSL